MLLYFALAIVLIVALGLSVKGQVRKKRLPLISKTLELMEFEYAQKVGELLHTSLKLVVDLDQKEPIVDQFTKEAYVHIKPIWRQLLSLLKHHPHAIYQTDYQFRYFPNLLTSCEQIFSFQKTVHWGKTTEQTLDHALREAIKADINLRILNLNNN